MIHFYMLRNFSKISFKNQNGITLLLVILVLSALLSISIGIFNSTFTELRISGELANSFQAMYAADQMLELTLYKDRVLQSTCASLGENCYTDTRSFSNGSCALVYVSKIGGGTTIKGIGQFDCVANSLRAVKRAFEVNY